MIRSLRHLLYSPVSATPKPDALRRRYHDLYAAETTEDASGGRRFHRARLWRCQGINIVSLHGDRFEMAFQHGRLLSDAIAHGTLDRASRIAPAAITNSTGDGLLGKIACWYAATCISAPMLRASLARSDDAPHEALAEAFGLSEGSGVAIQTIIDAALGAETAQTLLGKAEHLAVGAAPNQCTSFAAWGTATADGEMIIGRNTDYPLNGYFDAHPTVLYYTPTDAPRRYMTVTAAGFHNAGVCGMNDAGIYLAVHTVPTRSVSETGNPVFMLGQRVLREAATLAEARSMLTESPPAAGWNYHLVSVHEQQAATIELCHAEQAIRPGQGTWHVTTNHWSCPPMQKHHLFVNDTVSTDTRLRMERVSQMISAAGGKLNAQLAAAILADKHDTDTGRQRVWPNTVATSHTVSSSVWHPAAGEVWVANGPAPTSRGTFISLPSVAAFDPDTFEPADRASITSIQGCGSSVMAEAERQVIAGRKAYEYSNDAAVACNHMAEAARLTDDPALHLSHGLFAIRAGSYVAAAKAMDATLDCGWDDQRRAVATYLRSRLAAHAGRNDKALADLQRLLADPGLSTRLKHAAQQLSAALEAGRHVTLEPKEVAPMSILPDVWRYATRRHLATRLELPGRPLRRALSTLAGRSAAPV